MPTMFMPWPMAQQETLQNIVCVLGVTLPAWFMWPNLATGCWKECYADPDKIRLLNGFLFLLKCADKTNINCYIECIPESKLLTSNTMIDVYYYRLHIPLTLSDARQLILTICMELSETEEQQDGTPKKKRRKSNVVDRASPHVYEDPETFQMNNVQIGSDQINSVPSFLQWHATAVGQVKAVRSRQIIFDMPPDDNMFDGNVEYTDNESDADSEEDIFQVQHTQSLSQTEEPSPAAPSAFMRWYENNPKNHILKLLDMRQHFNCGTQRHKKRLNRNQLHFDKYYKQDTFAFPTFCFEHELITKIESGAPWLEGNVDNLVTAPFAHCAATLTMTSEELLRKMQSMAAITGVTIPEHYQTKTLKELRLKWNEQMSDGDADLSHYSSIAMLPPSERHINPHETESMKILADMYPSYGRYTEAAHTQFQCLREARKKRTVSAEHVRDWITEKIDSITQLYSDTPKEHFVSAYFRICSEAVGIRRGLYGNSNDPVLQEARRLCKQTIAGMSAGDTLLAIQAKLLRGSLHMTPAQASPLLYIWSASMTAIMPEIDCQQPTFCLLGGSDTGKSAIMTLLMLLVLSSAVIRQDTTSKLVMTANGELGVQCTDELKTGVDSESIHDSTNWLTSMSTGWHVHNRLQLGTTPGTRTQNVTTKSDRRRFMTTASNQKPHDNFASRMDITYVHGNQKKNDISRQELATVNDNTIAWHAAKMVFQFTWAEHEQYWRVQQHLRWYLCTSLFPVWHNMIAQLLGKKFSPSTREVGRISRDAIGFFLNRIIAEYRQTSREDEFGNHVSFVEFAMANSVVTLKDYTICFIQKRAIVKHDDQEDIFVKALINSITVEDDNAVTNKLKVYQRDYFVTSLSSVPEVCGRTKELSSSFGIGRDIMARLMNGSKSEQEAQVIQTKGRNGSMYAVHKNLITYSSRNPLLTDGMKTLLKFFKEILRRPITSSSPRLWYVGMDENQIIFKSPVKKRLLRPHTVDLESEVLQEASMQETDIIRSVLLLEAAGIMRYKDMSEPHPFTLHGTGTILNTTPEVNSQLVNRGGPLDELRVFGTSYLEETPDDEITPEYINEQSVRINAGKQPCRRMYKSPIRNPDVIIVKTEVLRETLDELLYEQLGVEAPATGDSSLDEQNAIHNVIDAMANVSGETPGAVWFAGSTLDPETVYATHVVRQYPKESITIKNPYRNTEGAHFSAHNNLNELVLPHGQDKVTFSCRNSTLVKDLIEKTAEINMVSYALLQPVPENRSEE